MYSGTLSSLRELNCCWFCLPDFAVINFYLDNWKEDKHKLKHEDESPPPHRCRLGGVHRLCRHCFCFCKFPRPHGCCVDCCILACTVALEMCYIITFSRRLCFSSHSHLLSLPILYTQQSLRGYATAVSEDEDSALEYAGMYPNVPVYDLTFDADDEDEDLYDDEGEDEDEDFDAVESLGDLVFYRGDHRNYGRDYGRQNRQYQRTQRQKRQEQHWRNNDNWKRLDRRAKNLKRNYWTRPDGTRANDPRRGGNRRRRRFSYEE